MFKKINIIIFVFGFLVTANPVFSGEITDMEIDVIGTLWITYYSGKNGRVDCTAYNNKEKPIGGGFGYASGGVARVMVQLPKKYQNSSVTASCK